MRHWFSSARPTVVALIALAGSGAQAAAPCNEFQFEKLLAPDGAGADLFGSGVSIAGNRALVGSSLDANAGGGDAGSAYVFRWDGTDCVQEAKLTASDAGATDQFGFAVSLTVDRALVGAHESGGSAGAAYVYRRSGVSWVQEMKLVGSDTAGGDELGFSVALSDDRAVVGALFANDGLTADTGAVYVFKRTGTSWAQEQKLQASDRLADDQFGKSVAIFGDRIIVGAWQDDNPAGMNSGSAYVFRFTGATWVQEQKLTAGDAAAGDAFGTSVSITADRALIGAFLDTAGASLSGSAYVFVRSGLVWTQEAKLAASDAAANDFFGNSVALVGDRALVGCHQDDDNGADSGSAYIYKRNGAVWTQGAKLKPADGVTTDRAGRSVALSSDRAILGAQEDDDLGGNSGSASVFSLPLPLAIERQPMDVTATQGLQATFAIVASGEPIVSYQWRRNSVDLVDGAALGGGQIIGATTSALVLTAVADADEGNYDCIVTDACSVSSVTSTPAALNAAPPPGFCAGDADGNHVVNFPDITSVLAHFNFVCP